MTICIYNRKSQRLVVFWNLLWLSCLGRSDLRGSTWTGTDAAENKSNLERSGTSGTLRSHFAAHVVEMQVILSCNLSREHRSVKRRLLMSLLVFKRYLPWNDTLRLKMSLNLLKLVSPDITLLKTGREKRRRNSSTMMPHEELFEKKRKKRWAMMRVHCIMGSLLAEPVISVNSIKKKSFMSSSVSRGFVTPGPRLVGGSTGEELNDRRLLFSLRRILGAQEALEVQRSSRVIRFLVAL